jgi:hypothetical protein
MSLPSYPRDRCPSCDEPLDDAVLDEGDRPPRPGDWTLCSLCVTWLRWTDTMGLREATAAEIAEARRSRPGMGMDIVERAIRDAMRQGRLG